MALALLCKTKGKTFYSTESGVCSRARGAPGAGARRAARARRRDRRHSLSLSSVIKSVYARPPHGVISLYTWSLI